MKILKGKSGASLVFIVGLALFLLAIGSSTLAAAYANSGYLSRQDEFNKINLLDKSIHENMMFSLQSDPENKDLLGYQIAKAIYEANDPSNNAYNVNGLQDTLLAVLIAEVGEEPINLNTLPGNVRIQSITLSFPEQFVSINPAIPAFYEEGSSTPLFERQPKSATVNASMVVEIEIDRVGGTTARTIITRALYQFTGGRLLEVGDTGAMEFIPEVLPDPLVIDDEGTPGGFGEWRLINYETVDR